MRALVPILAGAIVVLCAGTVLAAGARSKPFTINLMHAVSVDSFVGSQCDRKGYAGQCDGGDCECLSVLKAPVTGNNLEKGDEADVFLTIDKSLATGAPGCSPVFGMLVGRLDDGTPDIELNLAGTLCTLFKARQSGLAGGFGIASSEQGVEGWGNIAGNFNASNDQLTLSTNGIARKTTSPHPSP